MSRRELSAISTLVRWRALEEERASCDVRRRRAETQTAINEYEATDRVVKKVHARLAELQESTQLDLSRMDAVSRMEADIWKESQTLLEVKNAVQQREDEARATHLRTRAMTEVAEARKRQKTALHLDRDEKLAFDRMADIHKQNRRGTA